MTLLEWAPVKIILVLVLVALGVGAASVLWGRHRGRNSKQKATAEYRELREQILRGTRAQFGLAPEPNPTTPWGVVMDWGIDNRTVTVAALSDGSASIYYSSGGGSIGGGQSHESIRDAAKKAVAVAAKVQGKLKQSSNFSLPLPDEAKFYLLTDAGVFAGRAKVAELSSGRGELSKLGNAMQTIITEYMRLPKEPSGRNAN